MAHRHFAVHAQESLNDGFPARWIGRTRAIEWPASSPDLDLELANIQDLQRKIITECRRITPEVLRNVRDGFYSRLHYGIESNEGYL